MSAIFAAAGRRRHHRDERQSEHRREVRLGHRRRTRRRLDDRRVLADPAVAQRVEEQRPRQPVLEAAGDVGGLVLQVELDVDLTAGRAPRRRQRVPQQVGVGAAPGVGLDQADRVVHPRAGVAANGDGVGSVNAPRLSAGTGRPGYRGCRRRSATPPASTASPRVGSRTGTAHTATCRARPTRATACSAPHRDGPFARDAVEVAVGDDGTLERQAQLAAVGVPGQHQLVAVGGEAVEHPRCTAHAPGQVSGWPPGSRARRWCRSGPADRCGSSTPATAMSCPLTSISRRVCVMSSQPRSVNAARRSCHGSGSPMTRCDGLNR